MRNLIKISEHNMRRPLHMRERQMRGKGLMDVLSKLYKLYTVASTVAKGSNMIYRAPLVQKYIVPKKVKKYLNPVSNVVKNITDTGEAIEMTKKLLGRGEECETPKKKEVNPANDLLLLVSKKAKKISNPNKAKSIPVKVMAGKGLSEDILKKIIGVIAIEMSKVIVNMVQKKMNLSDDKTKMLDAFLNKKINELLKTKIELPNFSNALSSLGKIVTSPLKHMFGGKNAQYKKQKMKIMKQISNKANKMITLA